MHTATLIELIDDAGGFATRRQLRRAGATDRDLTRSVRSGDLHRPRLGWYSNLPLDDDRVTAVRVGGRLTGASALFHLGGWMWKRPASICVSVAPHAARLRGCRRARVVWDGSDVRERGGVAVVAVVDALVRAVLEEDFEIAVALCDWALHHGRVSADDFAAVLARLPADARGIGDWVDADSESILESVVRTRLRRAGFHVTSQVPVGFGRHTDLVVNGVLGVETDGRRWHADRFDEDVSKDMATFIRRRIPVHLSYSLITEQWDTVLAAVEAAVLMHRDGTSAGPAPRSHVRERPARSPVHRAREAGRATRTASRTWSTPRRVPSQVSHSWSARHTLAATPQRPLRTRRRPTTGPGHTGHDHRTVAKGPR
jgi:hypothetical protein